MFDIINNHIFVLTYFSVVYVDALIINISVSNGNLGTGSDDFGEVLLASVVPFVNLLMMLYMLVQAFFVENQEI